MIRSIKFISILLVFSFAVGVYADTAYIKVNALSEKGLISKTKKAVKAIEKNETGKFLYLHANDGVVQDTALVFFSGSKEKIRALRKHFSVSCTDELRLRITFNVWKFLSCEKCVKIHALEGENPFGLVDQLKAFTKQFPLMLYFTENFSQLHQAGYSRLDPNVKFELINVYKDIEDVLFQAKEKIF